MPLGNRILNVTFALPPGFLVGSGADGTIAKPLSSAKTVTFDATVDIKVRASKACLAIQQSCDIIITNMQQSLREALLSQITALNKRLTDQGQIGSFDANGNPINPNYVGVKIVAGYASASQSGYKFASTSQNATGAPQGNANPENTTIVFSGFAVQCDPVGTLPNLAVRIKCFNRAADNTAFLANGTFPGKTTFAGYASFVAQAMGLKLDCATSYDQRPITNPGASAYTVGALLWDLQSYFAPNVAVWVDNQTLYVRDSRAVIDTNSIPVVDEFIGTPPSYTEWGPTFGTLMDTRLKLGGAVQIESTINPSLGSASEKNQKQYVITNLDYALSSRDQEFYVQARTAPPA